MKVKGLTVKVEAAEILDKGVREYPDALSYEAKLSEVYQAPRVSTIYSSAEDHKKRQASL